MTTTNTERRLAITPGTWKVRGRYDVYAAVGSYIGTTRANNPEEMPENFRAIDEANATLIADAGTTYNACHLTPSELLVKLREAEELMNAVLKEYNDPMVMVRTPIAYFKKFSAMERFIANLHKHNPE